jgi:cold shock CspA family protein
MRKVLALSLMLAFALTAAAVAQDRPQTPPTDPASPPPAEQSGDKQSGKVVTGTVTRVDNTAKMFVVKDDTGKEVNVYWDDSTRGATDLKEGASVSVQTNDQGGRNMATSISVRTKSSY